MLFPSGVVSSSGRTNEACERRESRQCVVVTDEVRSRVGQKGYGRKMRFAIDGSFQTKALAKAGIDRVPRTLLADFTELFHSTWVAVFPCPSWEGCARVRRDTLLSNLTLRERWPSGCLMLDTSKIFQSSRSDLLRTHNMTLSTTWAMPA